MQNLGVYLIRETGEEIAHFKECAPLAQIVTRAIKQELKTHLLDYIDPYGDTYFNAMMFSHLLEDVEKLKEIAAGDKEIKCLNAFAACIKSAQKDVHVHVKLVGD